MVHHECIVIEEANNSDHNGKSYIVRVMKTGRLIMWNTKHMQQPNTNRAVPPGTGWLEDIFMKTVPVEHGRMFQSYRVASWTYITHNDRWGENNNIASNGDKWREVIILLQQVTNFVCIHIMVTTYLLKQSNHKLFRDKLSQPPYCGCFIRSWRKCWVQGMCGEV